MRRRTFQLGEDLTDKGTAVNLGPGVFPFSAVSRADWTNHFYGEYSVGKLRLDSEYRRFVHDQVINDGAMRTISDVRGWYVSGAYRITKRIELGSYYSRDSITSVADGIIDQMFPSLFPDQTDTATGTARTQTGSTSKSTRRVSGPIPTHWFSKPA
jgi:hypothetical protein